MKSLERVGQCENLRFALLYCCILNFFLRVLYATQMGTNVCPRSGREELERMGETVLETEKPLKA